ncbi:hypothetical protein TVAG_266030 [Trichomonas vaginalis G3]|uniref:Integral membrane protein n=1 Tax=Trichomonas vaginalis (strain ATCC PRA-98 / G3) TaxID=412133 RepID=A2F2K0_TRIV3|nr:SYS1-like protein family [Trichomonas vaginalis G3]EAY00900.1 hypothetical protein TVAG_266030 [Trichomonas vaginalis G3]KAI5489227.1 SYS1-like protein family [Trichomonas vaginalis G3]|eukprot:XP_001313829.1 hypothetical protein [Trichomonas vaginalis G3]
MFNPNIFSFRTGLGRISILSQMASSLCAGIVFAFVEQRHRKALDYMSTLYGVHIVLSGICCGIPTKFVWWIITFLGWAAATMSAEFISLRIESRAISIQDDADTLFVRDDTKKSSGYQI